MNEFVKGNACTLLKNVTQTYGPSTLYSAAVRVVCIKAVTIYDLQ